jgi:hypothetical protein
LKLNISNGKSIETIGAEVVRSTINITPIINNDEIAFIIKIDSEVIIYENSSQLDLSNPKSLSFVEDNLHVDNTL